MPRLCSAQIAAAMGVALTVAALGSARAQSPDPATVFRPLDGDPRNPGRFRRVDPRRQSGAPQRFQVYGNPPAMGAGSTGFDSTNTRRKTRSVPKPKPGASPSPGQAAAGTAAAPAVPIRPAPDPARRGAAFPPQAQAQAQAQAQPQAQAFVPTIATPTRRRAPATDLDPFAPIGLRAGAFTLFPAIELTGGLDTNPSHVPGGRESSLLIVAPELKVRSDWQRHALNADIKGTYTAYGEKFGFKDDGSMTGVPNSLDRPSLDARANGRLDITSRNRLDVEGRLLVGTDNPGSPNIQAGLARLPIVTTLGTTLGYTHSFNRLEITAKGAFDRSVWQDSTLTDGSTANNDDRNFNQYAVGLRGSYELTPGVKPFVEVGTDTRVHDLAFDRFGAQRDSNGINAKVGSTFEITRKLTGEASVGYLTRHYKDPTLQDLAGLTMDASLVFTATALTTFTATAKSTANEVVVPGVSGNLARDFTLQVDHSFRRWLLGTAKLGFGIDDYVGFSRTDQRWYASAALIYKLSRNVQLKGEVRRDWLNSSVPNVDYTATQFLLGVRLQD